MNSLHSYTKTSRSEADNSEYKRELENAFQVNALNLTHFHISGSLAAKRTHFANYSIKGPSKLTTKEHTERSRKSHSKIYN